MKIHDITYLLNEETIKYKSLDGYQNTWIKTLDAKDDCNMSVFSFDSHVGTHLDAALHYVKDGTTITEVDLARFFCKAQVIEVEKTLTKELLESKMSSDVSAVLCKFTPERIGAPTAYFTTEAIDYMYEKGIQTIGTDNFNVDSAETGKQIHLSILPKELSILEVLDLRSVNEGIYEMVALPLKIANAEASSTRVLLLEEATVMDLFK